MSVPPGSIEAGKCYLTNGSTVRRVVAIHADGRVQYEWRLGHRKKWKAGILTRREFVATAGREVSCD